MDISPPPSATGLRVQDLGESLIVDLRPRRMWGELVFLAIWLTFWTVGGIAAIAAFMSAPWGGRAFLAVWLCGWVFGECAAIAAIAWQLFGHEVLTVTHEQLEVRLAVGRFSRTKQYEALLVRDVVAAPVPTDADEKPRKDFCLQFSYADKTVSIGEGLNDREARQLAALVLGRIRPRSWWREDEPTEVYGLSTPSAEERVEPPAAGHRWRAVAFIAAGLIALSVVAVIRDDHAPPPRRATSPPSTPQEAVPPPRDAFAAARTYASATTAYLLRAGRMTMIGMPVCTSDMSWTSWRCTVRAQATIGPFAGRTMSYYCDSRHVCGPDRPPITGGPQPPSRADYSEPREFAAATTIYALRSGGTLVRATPACGARVTWAPWRCTVPARPTLGPYAGRTLTYYCSPDATQVDGPGQSITCGPTRPPPLNGTG